MNDRARHLSPKKNVLCALCVKIATVAINFASDGEDAHDVKYCDKHAKEFGVKQKRG